MKQFLLIIIIALPSLMLAQPTLTFSPINGATNVSTIVIPTIGSNEGLKTTAGVNLDDDNVDDLITLVDGSSNPVGFDAEVDGPRTTITITLDAPLQELTTYTLTLQPVEGNGGQETTTKVITFTTGDFTEPSFNTAHAINNNGDGFTFRVNVDEGATVYYVVDRDATTPDINEVRNGKNGDNVNAEASGSFTVTANTNVDEIISGLDFTPPVKFNIYFFAEDNASPKNAGNVTTRGIPLLISSSILALEPDGFDLRVNIDEPVTTYYVVTQSATPPSASEILAGQNESGGTPDQSGSFSIPSGNTDTDHTLTGLDDVTTYYIHFVATDGAGNETIVRTETATTTDGTPPAIVTLSPSDGLTAVEVSTNTFTITFDENVTTINTAASDDSHRIRLFENGVMKEDIDRDDITVGTDGAIIADGTSPTATITFQYDLLPYKNYYILIGSQVFEDAAQNVFPGLPAATDWNFTASGVTVNNAINNICSGSFQPLGNIVISETAAGDFNTGAGQTLILSLENTSEFVIANSGVTVTGSSADITALSVSVGMTSLTITYTVAAETVVDNITISGLKLYATGAVANTTIIRTGGSASQEGNQGTGPANSIIHSTINVGATPPGQPQLEASQDLDHCVDEDLTAKTLTLVDQGAVTYNWYRDAALTDLAVSTSDVTVQIAADLGLASPAVSGTYKFYVVSVSACQSAPPIEVVLRVGNNPQANAGTDMTGASAVCSGANFTLGGNPTLVTPSAAGSYSYNWQWLESTPEPASMANPVHSVSNATTSTEFHNFEVTITDVYGCMGLDTVTVEVKPSINVSLISPNSNTFTPNSPNQTLEASVPGGVFSGVGVVQSNSGVYQFSPQVAHATDPNTLPKYFQVYYSVSAGGCSVDNVLIATFTISNSFFSALQPQYCSSEYPTPAVAGVELSVDLPGYTIIDNKKTSWNTNERFFRGPYNTEWQSGNSYAYASYVRYQNEIYQCAATFLGLPTNCSGSTPPSSSGSWELRNILKVAFKGYIANYYENYFGGNSTGSTIVKSAATYAVGGNVYNYYRFGTNIRYNNCPDCAYAWPGAYLEFDEPEDVRLVLQVWSSSRTYFIGALVNYGGRIYKCIADYSTGQPNMTPSQWTDVTDANYGDGNYFHTYDADLGKFRSGFYVNGQFVGINRNPEVFFSGLSDTQDVCQYNVLHLDNVAGSSANIYELTGNLAKDNYEQEFLVRLDGSATLDEGTGTITNDIFNPGTATFNSRLAFENSPGGSASVKNIEIQYVVDPGTEGSTLQPCYGTSSIVVQVLQNSTFNFAGTVDPEGSVYCYTEAAKPLHASSGGVITGAAGAPNSVVYSGYGVNNKTNSEGTFTPQIAIDQISLGTTVQQLIPVTALYRDANQCQSTRVRTFKVNPDIQPSFTFGGRENYCYEDVANAFTGHFQDFTYSGGTVTSSGQYELVFRKPDNDPDTLQIVSSNNTSFTPGVFYNNTQQILNGGGFSAYMNQTISLNVVYTESYNAGKVCSETFERTMVINPPLVLDIFGFNQDDILCRNDNANLSQGKTVVFEGSQKPSGSFNLDDDSDFTSINPSLNSTVLTNSGQATINLLSAYNAATGGAGRRDVFLQYVYTAPGCTGPANVIKRFEISPPPPISFNTTEGNSPPNLEVFCKEETPVQLIMDDPTNVTFSGFGVTDGGNGTATFDPELGFNTSVNNGGTLSNPQDITVIARVVDGYSCANQASLLYTVNPTPPANVDLNGLSYCYEDVPRTLEGDQAISWFSIEYQGVTTPYTEAIGDIDNPESQITFNPRARFDHAVSLGASTLTPATFKVYYTAADAEDCTNTLGPFTLSVANLIDVSIAGVDDGDIYCSNENNGTQVLSFNPFPSDATKRRFLKDGQVEPLSTNKFEFKPGLSGGDFELIYIVYSGENDCSNTDTTRVTVLPSPRALFTAPPACEGDLIDFMANGSENQSSAVYTWTLDDSVRTGQNLQHRFPGTNNYGVNLHVQYPAFDTGQELLVCQDSLRRDQVVGQVPKELNFNYFNVCEEDPTRFEIQPDIPVNRVSWSFGDNVETGLGFTANDIPPTVSNTTGTYQVPIHTYASANTYEVIITAKTSDFFGGCELTDTLDVAILKNWTPTGGQNFYDMSQLDGGKGFWVVEDENGNSTWDFNTPAKTSIQTNEMTWVTGASLPYKAGDASYVNSPCFDLSTFSRPVLSIKHWSNTEGTDGAVLQYSADGGETWQRLGNVASGIDWYNALSIQSNPGSQTGILSGWSTAEQNQWAVGKHTLDVLPTPRNKIRFRVAFSSYKNELGKDGFAFNDVIIEERNRTILVENFTELSATVNNTNFRDFRASGGVFNPDELVKLQYHHASTQNDTDQDALHLANPVDQNARAAFYGVTGPVRAFVDGGFGQTAPNPTFNAGTILDTYFSLRSLVTSPVDISISLEPEPSDKLNVKATVQATTDVGSPGEYNVFIAIAEKDILGQVYVLRKFLPTAAGTPLTALAVSDPAQEIEVSYDMRHVTRLPGGDFAPFAVIVFVQNIETKDVLQTYMWQNGTAPSEIVTGVEASLDNLIRLYPNPADAELNIILSSPVKDETPVKLFDTFGKQVYTGTFKTGEQVKTLPTKMLASGVYLMQLSTQQGFLLRKAIVAHE